jgi:chitosanase
LPPNERFRAARRLLVQIGMPVSLPAIVPSEVPRIIAPRPAGSLTAEQRLRADKLVAIFENGEQFEGGKPVRKVYEYCERLADGRGYTAGWAGFTTGTADALEVIEQYQKEKPGNPLARYLPRLRVLAAEKSESIAGLSGFPDAWRAAAADPAFRRIQDDVVDKEYYAPAMARADSIGAMLPLTRAALYEAVIMHGDGDDPDSLKAIMDRATRAAGGTPREGVSEPVWLSHFLRFRKQDLHYANDPATRQEWRAAEGRADAMLALFKSGNFEFRGPITVNPYGASFTIP